jgi:hypothetical protein
MSPAGQITPLDMIYGYRPFIERGNLFMAHHTGFTARTLGLALLRARFRNVEVKRSRFDLWALAHKSRELGERSETGKRP